MLHMFQQQHTVSAATTYRSVTRPAEEQSTNFQVHVGEFHVQSARTSLLLFVDSLKAKRACLSTAEQPHEIRRQQQANTHMRHSTKSSALEAFLNNDMAGQSVW